MAGYRGVALCTGECNTPTAYLDAHTWNLHTIKDKHADQPAKKTCSNLTRLCAAFVEPSQLETTQFQK
jgi:hypothetical protein